MERTRRFRIDQPRHRGRTPLRRQTAQIDRLKGYRQFGCGGLNRLVVYAGKGRAENFMAPDDFVDGALERVCIQTARQSQGAGNIINRGIRGELMENLDSLLRERQGSFSTRRSSRSEAGSEIRT